ncbi:TetR/AcrR family transcriptional regulator [Arthrobacter sp. zg-Y40]|uniref:TetR/AcrR family transcriptional regulator n=1 Tax=Arthrobacter sp. zg-Y40 TaxID=2886939 RepID=UPI001D137853|nr:TetR/AcrR family transcriptional regulator [Arthrobacter sp. zg-Y40]
MAERSSYHHGNLRSALLEATIALVRERGPRGFTVAEAARRAGVSSGAPYRHFADRDAMLAAVAQQAFTELETYFAGLRLESSLGERAEQIAVAYLVFAREDPTRFAVMFGSGINKDAYPELLEQAGRVQVLLEAAVAPFVPAEDVVQRAAELWSIAHGVTDLAIGGNLRHVMGPERLDGIASSAARAWAAGLAGNSAH